MARLWSCGFELQSATSGVEWDTTTGAPTIDNTTVRSGLASLRCNPAATTAYIQHTFQADTVNTTYHRFYLNLATAPAATIKVWQYLDSGNSVGFSLNITNGRVLQMVNDAAGVTVLASSSALNASQWHRVEVKIVDSATTIAQMELLVNGAVVSSQTGLTGLNGGGRIRIGACTGTSSPNLYLDDLAINDTSGSLQTLYPGDGKITHMQIDTSGDSTQWQDQASAAQGTASFLNVDEVSPDDATTYNKRTTNTPATTPIDDWATENALSAGIKPADTITLIQVGVRAGAISATATARSIKTRVKSAPGGSVTASATTAVNVNGWTTHKASSPKIPQLTSYTDPTTGAPWQATGTNSLDNMQIGYQADVSSANEIRISALWALVEYVSSVNILINRGIQPHPFQPGNTR